MIAAIIPTLAKQNRIREISELWRDVPRQPLRRRWRPINSDRWSALRTRVEGQLVFNTLALRLQAASAGLGLAYVPEDQVSGLIASRRLVRVLADWCPAFPGYHLYYPNRRQPTPAFSVIVEALRHRS